jgi:hypothetical protein
MASRFEPLPGLSLEFQTSPNKKFGEHCLNAWMVRLAIKYAWA